MSKFSGLRSIKKTDAEVGPETLQKAESAATQKSENLEVQAKKMGRPKAKRSNPDFMQVTALIRVDTHLAVWHKLLDEKPKREFSELMEELLSEWARR